MFFPQIQKCCGLENKSIQSHLTTRHSWQPKGCFCPIRFKFRWLLKEGSLIVSCSLLHLSIRHIMFGRSNKKNPAHVDHNAFFHCREHIKEKFLNDLRKIREQHTGEALAKVSSILTFFFWLIRKLFNFWRFLIWTKLQVFSVMIMCRP